jgi:hypothetical protein
MNNDSAVSHVARRMFYEESFLKFVNKDSAAYLWKKRQFY